MTRLVSTENIEGSQVESFIQKKMIGEWSWNSFKTSQHDEVLQIYNDTNCYTIIGGSSKDKFEWKSNFSAFPLVNKVIHKGFWRGAKAVLCDKEYVEVENMMFIGHSRGGAISSVLCYMKECKGVGFGSPKAFRKKVSIRFCNIKNPLDPVCHVVPTFKTVGNVLKLRFIKNPHTKYGDHISDMEVAKY